MKIALGSYWTAVDIPSARVEKVKILPTNKSTGEQEFEVTLSLCALKRKSLMNSPYMIFLGFCQDISFLERIRKNDLLAKDLIKNPLKKGQILTKEYVSPDRTDRRIEKISLGGQRTAYKKEITIKRSVSSKGLENMYLYVTTYPTQAKANIGSRAGTIRRLNAFKLTPPVVETLMRNGVAPLSSLLFTVAPHSNQFAGELWAGPARFNGAAGYSGIMGPSVVPLTAHKVSNQKVQDLRFLNTARSLPFNSALNRGRRLSRKQTRMLAQGRKIMNPPGIISDCVYSRTTTNEVKLFFSIDYARLVNQNAKLGRFYQNPTALDASFKIEDIRIYRQRVQLGAVSPTTVTPGKIRMWGSSEALPNSPPVLVGTLKNGKVKPVSFSGLNAGVVSIVATDSAVSQVEVGGFQYTAEVDVVDMTSASAAYLLRKLENNLSEYNKYIFKANRAGMPGLNSRRYLKGNSSRISGQRKEWKRLIYSYIAAVEFIFGSDAFGTWGRDGWVKNLLSMINPANGDMKAMLQVAEIVGDFTSNLRQLSTPPTRPTSVNKFNVRSKVNSQNSTKRKSTIRHTFKTNYDQVGSPARGSDYLDRIKAIEHAENFTNITFNQYKARMTEEMKKYGVPRPNGPGINKYGFISPKRLSVEGSEVDTSQLMLSQSLGNGILRANLLASGVRHFVPSNRSNNHVYDNEIKSILGDCDIQMVPNTRRLSEVVKSANPIVDRTHSSTDYISAGAAFNTNDSGESPKSGSLEQNYKDRKSKQSRINKSKLSNFVVSAKATGFKRPTQVAVNFAVDGSFAGASATQRPMDILANSGFGNSVNFNSVVQVQYFDGYLETKGVTNLRAPRWRPLTEKKFQQFAQNKNTVLCRLLKLSPAMRMVNRYDLPLYDSLFILGETSAKNSTTNVTEISYIELCRTLEKQVVSSMKQNALNIESPLGALDPAHTAIPYAFASGRPINARPVTRGTQKPSRSRTQKTVTKPRTPTTKPARTPKTKTTRASRARRKKRGGSY